MMEEKTQNDITIKIQKESKTPIDNVFIDLKDIKKIGKYSIIKELDTSGGQADIFLVKDNNKNQFILKLYKKNVEINDLAIKKIIELSKNYSNYFIKIYELNYDPNLKRYYEIQEYVQYGNLEEFNKNFLSKNLDYELIDKIIYKINEGLNILHKNGIIHRDLKPTNILIRDIKKYNNKIIDLDLIITDFNISTLIDSNITKKITQDIKGTISYLAPETFSNIIKKESDYWSLGIIIYELLTNCNPFENINLNLIIYTLLTKGVEIPQNLPLKYKILLKGLLQINPDKRFTYNQVKEVLTAKTEQELKQIESKYFNDTITETEIPKQIIKYNNKEYYSLENLLAEFIKDYKSFLEGLEFFKTPEFRSLLNQKDQEIINKIYSYRNIEDEIAFSLFLSYKLNLPFSLYNVNINSQTIITIIDKYLDKIELNPNEYKILNSIINIFYNQENNLEKYYNIYLNTNYKRDIELENFFTNLNKIKIKNINNESILKFILVLSLNNKEKYIIPKQLKNFNIFKYILVSEIPLIEDIIKKEELEYLNKIYILPYEVKNLENYSIADYIQIVNWLKNNKDDLILKKELNISRDISIKDYEILRKKLLQQKINQQRQPSKLQISQLEYNKLVVLNRLLMENNLIDKELSYYLNNPQNINWQIYSNLYQRNIINLVNHIYSKNRRFRIPSSLIVLSFIFIFLCLFLGIGFFVCRNPYTFLYIFGWNFEYLYSCVFAGIILLILFPLILSPFIITDIFLFRGISKEKIQIELENRINSEAQRLINYNY
ncbi:MAG: serine/threonine-protein kinase [bacterium]